MLRHTRTPRALSRQPHRLMKDQRRQVRVVDLDQEVQESFAAGKGKGMVTKGPKGFLEGALLNREVAAAHDKFMADVEVRARGCGCFFPLFLFFRFAVPSLYRLLVAPGFLFWGSFGGLVFL